MRPRITHSAFIAVLLMISAAPAHGADQGVEVEVIPAGTLGIEVQDLIDFGRMEVGQSATQPFVMRILNQTDAGWRVTVDGADLQGQVLTDPVSTIDSSNLVVTGGDACFTEACDPAADTMVTPYSVALSGSPVMIMEGTAQASGDFGFGSPHEPTVQLTIPADAVPNQYATTLTYTVMAE
ncbi:MAG: hypothetical protein WEC14_09760 [Chloroflexota bacterium]